MSQNSSTELKKQFAALNVAKMIDRGDEIFLIEEAIKAGAVVDIPQCTKIATKRNNCEILEMLKNNEKISFEPEHLYSYAIYAIEDVNALNAAIFFIENGAGIRHENDRIFRSAIREYQNYNYDEKFYPLLKAILDRMVK